MKLAGKQQPLQTNKQQQNYVLTVVEVACVHPANPKTANKHWKIL